MIQLTNGCYCSDLKVNPSNWESTRASCAKDWYIYYRFYDPLFKSDKKFKKGKLVVVKGMNVFSKLKERQVACRGIIELELNKLVKAGYNPITCRFTAPMVAGYEIDPSTNICNALELAFNRKQWEPHTKEDIRSILKYFTEAAEQIRIDNISIYDVRRKHIKAILTQIGQSKNGWSAVNFNKYRGYLHSLFKELVQMEAIELNPVTDIERMKGLRKIRDVLNRDQRKKVVDHLSVNYPAFYRFIQIFFHSGARRTELLKLKVRDVDIQSQTYKVEIKKGREYKEVIKHIKNIAVPFWIEALAGACPDHYVFSEGLKPGTKSIRPEQITRRWKEHVKKKLGINADLYSLKHLNTTEMVDAIDEHAAAKLNSHTNTAMVTSIYDVMNDRRKIEIIKSVYNKL